jgi:hypothetical protein
MWCFGSIPFSRRWIRGGLLVPRHCSLLASLVAPATIAIREMASHVFFALVAPWCDGYILESTLDHRPAYGDAQFSPVR